MDSDDGMDFEAGFEDDNEEILEHQVRENEQILKHEALTLAKLRGKELVVQNRYGTLRCPLSPSRKKQAYAYKDLLQHATAVASGKQGPEAAGNHSALKKFLESDLSSLSTPPPERLVKVEENLPPRLQPGKDMLVWPWSIVICNIDNSRRDTAKPDFPVGLGKTELREYFKDFKPIQLKAVRGPRGHLRMCVLQFGGALSGLKDAQALENSFLHREHGLREYERHLGSGNLGNDFYGWLAREDDYNGRRCGKEWHEVGKYFQKYADLKDIEMVADEIQLMHDQEVRQLAAAVSKKNQESKDLKTEMEIIRRTAETERRKLEESHKLELEGLRMKAKVSEDEYNQATVEREEKLEELESNQEDQEALITTLTVKDRQSTEEIEDARKNAVQVILLINKSKKLIEAALKQKDELDPTEQPQPRVAVRMAGEIDETSWPSAFKKKDKGDVDYKCKGDVDWGLEMKEALSSWEELIKNPEFNPFKMVQIGDDTWKKEIDCQNAKLLSLKRMYGEEVYNSVTTALMEIEEYNASGRYPVAVPWIPEKSRKASLKEVVAYLGEIITALTGANAPRKKARC